MINYKKFDIENDGKKIVLYVELHERYKGSKVQICTTDDILIELKARGIEVAKCEFSPDLVSDRNQNRISGKWIFNLPHKQERVIPQKPIKVIKTTKKSIKK